MNKMIWPTIEEVNTASEEKIAEWWRTLKPTKPAQVDIMHTICQRYEGCWVEYGED